MSPLAQAIGRVIREHREQRKLSREALAEGAFVPVEDVTAAEDGRRLLGVGKLERIAEALGLESSPLCKGQAVIKPDVALFFRHGSVPDFFDEDVDRLRPAFNASLYLLDMKLVLKKPADLRTRFAPEPIGSRPHRSGYEAARRVRAETGNRYAPLTDLRAIVEDRFGVVVVATRLRTRSVLAVTVKEPSSGAAAIVLNAAQVDYGRYPLVGRVSLAHELAHVLFDDAPVTIERDDVASAPASDPIEQRARAFAAELLIPFAGLLARFGRPRRLHATQQADKLVDQVRALYLAPVEITVNHLMNLGYFVRDEALRLNLIKAAASRTSAVDSIEIPPVAPAEDAPSISLLAHTREAHERILITDGRARDVLDIPLGEPLPWEAQP